MRAGAAGLRLLLLLYGRSAAPSTAPSTTLRVSACGLKLEARGFGLRPQARRRDDPPPHHAQKRRTPGAPGLRQQGIDFSSGLAARVNSCPDTCISRGHFFGDLESHTLLCVVDRKRVVARAVERQILIIRRSDHCAKGNRGCRGMEMDLTPPALKRVF